MGPQSSRKKGAFVLISGSSGSGKTTIAARLLDSYPGAVRLLTTTTRKPREHERDGVDYRFVSREEFLERVARNEFVEHAEVYGNLYGSQKSDLEGLRDANRAVIAVVDVQGTDYIKGVYPEAVTVYLAVGMSELRKRLEKRGDLTAEEIERRMGIAESESARASGFSCMIRNGDGMLDDALHAVALVIDMHAPD